MQLCPICLSFRPIAYLLVLFQLAFLASICTPKLYHIPATGTLGSPPLFPRLSLEPQKESNLAQVVPSGSCCVQPSLSPGVLSQKYASMREGKSVEDVGKRPTPEFLILHQLAQSERIPSTPLRPVSMIKCAPEKKEEK